MSEETKKKLSLANQGKTLSEEHKAKIGAAGKGRTHTEATKAKIGAVQKRKTRKNSFRRISCEDKCCIETEDQNRQNTLRRCV